MRFVLALFLAALAASEVAAQAPRTAASLQAENARLRARVDSLQRVIAALRTPTPAAPQSAASSLASLVPARLDEPYEGSIAVKFDRFEKATAGVLDDLAIRDRFGREAFEVAFLFTVPGEHTAFPETVSMILRSSSKDWRYLRCHSLALLADGNRVQTSEAEHNGSVMSYGVSEAIVVLMPTAEFFKMAGAAKVEGKLCNVEFSLNIKQVFALREFANRMKPAVP